MEDERAIELEYIKESFDFIKKQKRYMKKLQKEATDEKEREKYSDAKMHYIQAMKALKYYYADILFGKDSDMYFKDDEGEENE